MMLGLNTQRIYFVPLTAHDMEILIQTCLMPLAIKTQSDSLKFVHELKQEMHADLKYVESLEKEIDELESDKAEFSDMYDVILQECVSKDVMCSYLQSLSDLDALAELQFLGKPTPFSNSLDRIYFQKTMSVSKANVSEGLSKPVTAHTLPHTAKKAVSNTDVLKLGIQVKVKKTQVEVHPRIPSVSNKMKSVTACKDNLNSRTLNANALCATCNKCLIDSNHFACVTKMLNDVHARTTKPTVLPISTRKLKSQANKSIATSNKKKIVQLILFIVDSGCTKHMTGNLKLLCNFVEKFLDLEVAFRKSTCFVRDLQGNDLLVGNRGSDLYIISLQESTSTTPLCLMAKATPTQAWLWHRRLSHLNFDYINLLSKKDIVIGLPKLKYVKDQLCSSCELSKAKRSSFKSKDVPSSKGRLNLLHMDLCGPMRVASINGKKYILRWQKLGQNEGKGGSVHSGGILYSVKGISGLQQENKNDNEHVPSQQELDLLFGPLYDEFFNAGSNPSTNIESTSAPSTHTNVHAEENNNDQSKEGEQLQDDEFTNPFCAPTQDLATDPEMCMYALTVSTAKPKNVKEEMADRHG
nr:retrovirus-related Pol polyprotein from transposon TNT 1-94 [Tanacetum cinerariifolium]